MKTEGSIARLWHGRVRRADAVAYGEYIRATGLADYKATPGNKGAWMLIDDSSADIADVYTLSFWESLDAIAAFAGSDIDRARYYPEDDRFLLEHEPTVKHFRLIGPP